MVLTASTGYFPTAVSPDSIVAAQPSSTALVISLTSAFVGNGFSIIVCNTSVAIITGMPCTRARAMICFWKTARFSRFVSTDKSPLSIIAASVASKISSILSRPPWFSILATIRGQLPPVSSRIASTCAADSTKLMPIKSTELSRAKLTISRSRSVTSSVASLTNGTLIPLRLSNLPAVSARQRISRPSTLTTVNRNVPSSANMFAPSLSDSCRVKLFTGTFTLPSCV